MRDKVVRAKFQNGEKLRKERGEKKLLVVFRHKLKMREELAAGAIASDRALSWMVTALIREAPAVDASAQAHRDERGTPSEDIAITINKTVEVAGEYGGVSDRLVGEYCDQAYYLQPEEVARIESLAAQATLTPDQTLDWLIATRLSTVIRPVNDFAAD
jgi:hypothetical protein